MKVFSPFTIKDMQLKNRLVMPPMCMYSSENNGCATDWHISHYEARAVGNVGLIIVEAAAVTPNGRITDRDLGIWNDQQIDDLKRLVASCQRHGSKIALQLAHAGRKCNVPEATTVAPSSYHFSDRYPVPDELTIEQLNRIIQNFRQGARRANEAGFDGLELHAAHGYLIHEFLSPLSNRRKDEYGGSREERVHFLLDVIEAVKEEWPENKPLWIRVSADDYLTGGIDINEMTRIIDMVKDEIDLVHVSSGGLEQADIDVYPGYQVEYAEIIRERCEIPTIAVGLITQYEMVEEILQNKRADLVALGRELLRKPYWVLNSARDAGISLQWPTQYERAFK